MLMLLLLLPPLLPPQRGCRNSEAGPVVAPASGEDQGEQTFHSANLTASLYFWPMNCAFSFKLNINHVESKPETKAGKPARGARSAHS